MKTDYKDSWPGMGNLSAQEPALEMRIGQLKYDLRQSQTTVRTLEWVVLIEFVIIVALCVF